MEIFDISVNINENMPVYKNREEKKPKIILDKEYKKDNINESSIHMNLHTGTHLDAPFHTFEKGKTIEELDISQLITPCTVLDLTDISEKITSADLEKFDINKGDFILLKTQNSYDTEFNFEFVFLEKSGAEYLANKKIKGVGIDSLGIERSQENHPTHSILMGEDIYILEGLNLKYVDAGKYKLIALPIKIDGVDGAPVRAVLVNEDSSQ
jgi:arylformamidase